MRRVVFMLIALTIAIGARAVTIDAINRPAEKVFAEIARQTGKNFVYDSSLLRGLNVSITAHDERLESVLRRMFAGHGIGYTVKGRNITLYRITEAKAEVATPSRRMVTIGGFVREANSGEAIIGAIVTDSLSRTVVTTNEAGFFSLTAPVGDICLTVLYPGFTPYRRELRNVTSARDLNITLSPSQVLEELTVEENINDRLTLDSPHIGSVNLSRDRILNTPVLLGESDVVKALQLEPGVSAGIEGTAGLNVHGGENDQNLYMLDNIPLYQVNHFGGLFSAFNTSAIKNVDFYKNAFPASMDGRLSSYMDVHTLDGSLEEHHGSFTLGLTSGAFDINGPIVKGKTSYSLALRRSWYDVISIPALAIANATNSVDKTSLGYSFTDLNAKITHHFSDRSRAWVMFYFGEDRLHGGTEDKDVTYWYSKDMAHLTWGNIVASAGWTHAYNSRLFGSLTAAFTRYHSTISNENTEIVTTNGVEMSNTFSRRKSLNSIDDWIAKYTVDWHPAASSVINAGVGASFHTFLPSRAERTLRTTEDGEMSVRDTTATLRAGEYTAFVAYDFTPSNNWRLNAGVHYTLFAIDGKVHQALSPRLSLRYSPARDWAVKASYSRTCQPVYQLSQSLLSLPTDQWMPITAEDAMPTADNISLGVSHRIDAGYTFSIEGYYKWLHNIIDYRDEYYLLPPECAWNALLDHGKGRSRGIDFKVAKTLGRITGHISYSLMWADRQFENRNGGRRYPARFDNRHKINILANWQINDRWQVNAAWTGMSGNMFTLMTQNWLAPDGIFEWEGNNFVRTDINNYRLPFYHRLDLSVTRQTRHGHWSISLFNAYCHFNAIAVKHDYNIVADRQIIHIPGTNQSYETYSTTLKPVFKTLSVLPIIPSFSYTWIF